MELIIIRHGDPDYGKDCLTDLGKKQAEALAKYIKNYSFDKVYSSPSGRAYQTAQACFGIGQIEVKDWLTECWHELKLLDGSVGANWDFLPQYICGRDEFYNVDKYLNTPEMKSCNMDVHYEQIVKQFDQLLASHGYVREGRFYRAVKPNKDKIVIFCHFGMTCVLLSHLAGIPYVLLAQHFFASPTSITRVVTEERKQGIAQFRCIGLGTTPHLALDGQSDGFSGRYCETFDSDEKH